MKLTAEGEDAENLGEETEHGGILENNRELGNRFFFNNFFNDCSFFFCYFNYFFDNYDFGFSNCTADHICGKFRFFNSVNEDREKSFHKFGSKFYFVESSNSNDSFCSDFAFDCVKVSNHFGSERDFEGCSESDNRCINIFCKFFSRFFNRDFVCNDLTFFFGNEHDAGIFCNVNNRCSFFNNFFRENCGSHSSTHKSCKDKGKSFLHFKKYPP